MDKYLDKFRIPSARLEGWDYGAPGLYFVTICTENRACFFGNIFPEPDPQDIASLLYMEPQYRKQMQYRKKTQNIASLQSTEIGNMAIHFWQQIPQHFSFIELDDYVLMPNHLHGILFINKPDHENWQINKFGPQRQNLPSVIRGYKAAVKKYATLNNLDFCWQSRYYDRVIRSEQELQRIREYIQNNPNKWDQDKNNPEGILM